MVHQTVLALWGSCYGPILLQFKTQFKRFTISHAADTRSAKEDAADKRTTKDDMLVNPALAPINPNVRARKYQNLAVAKARAEAGLENTANKDPTATTIRRLA